MPAETKKGLEYYLNKLRWNKPFVSYEQLLKEVEQKVKSQNIQFDKDLLRTVYFAVLQTPAILDTTSKEEFINKVIDMYKQNLPSPSTLLQEKTLKENLQRVVNNLPSEEARLVLQSFFDPTAASYLFGKLVVTIETFVTQYINHVLTVDDEELKSLKGFYKQKRKELINKFHNQILPKLEKEFLTFLQRLFPIKNVLRQGVSVKSIVEVLKRYDFFEPIKFQKKLLTALQQWVFEEIRYELAPAIRSPITTQEQELIDLMNRYEEKLNQLIAQERSKYKGEIPEERLEELKGIAYSQLEKELEREDLSGLLEELEGKVPSVKDIPYRTLSISPTGEPPEDATAEELAAYYLMAEEAKRRFWSPEKAMLTKELRSKIRQSIRQSLNNFYGMLKYDKNPLIVKNAKEIINTLRDIIQEDPDIFSDSPSPEDVQKYRLIVKRHGFDTKFFNPIFDSFKSFLGKHFGMTELKF